jgi:hypothetical protein
MHVSRFVPKWLSYQQRTCDKDREERTLAVLVGAKALIERGWIQGGWCVLEAPDGRRRFVGSEALTRRSFGTVVQACLVAGVVEAATRLSAEPMTAGPALDALWRALLTAEGRQLDPAGRVPSPTARGVQVGELTRWNDHQDRTREDVVGLVDAAIGQVMAARSTRASDEARVAALATT